MLKTQCELCNYMVECNEEGTPYPHDCIAGSKYDILQDEVEDPECSILNFEE